MTIPLPGTPVLSAVALHDSGSNMQSVARQAIGAGSWFFAQVMQDGRFGQTHAYHLAHGDLTLTRITKDGASEISFMYLRGFGHGVSMSIQPDPAGGVFVWIEAKAVQGPTSNPDAWGTQVARVKWVNGATVWPSSAGVTLFDPFPGQYRVGPSLDLAAGLIAVRHMTAAMAESYTIYSLDAFTAGDFTGPVSDIPAIPAPGTTQGWSLMPGGASIALYSGDTTTAANPAPGNSLITTFGATGVLAQAAAPDATAAGWEPEGVQAFALDGQIINGWGISTATGHVMNLYSRLLP